MRRLILGLIILCLSISSVAAQEREKKEVRANVTVQTAPSREGFTLSNRFMPTARRIDREVNKNVFAYKGEVALGLTASYGTLSSDNSDIFALLEHVNLSGSITTVSPYVGYFFKDNACVGVRMGYSYMGGTVDNVDLNLGSANDIDIKIPWVDANSNNLKFSAFLRHYAAIDKAGRFGVFSELEASYSFGDNRMGFRSGDEPVKFTESRNTTAKLWFNPGVAVYMFPNVCATVSFGMGGFKYTTIKQYDAEGEQTGSRTISKLRFRLNVADIHFGMNIHLWSKKGKRK